MKFERLQKEVLEILGQRMRTNEEMARVERLINKVLTIHNEKIRVYYNFSIKSFTNLLANTEFEEFDGLLKIMNPKKQYSIETLDGLTEFLEFLVEENDMKLYKEIKESARKINNNLYIYEVGDLNQKHWL